MRTRSETIRCPGCLMVQGAEVIIPDQPTPIMPFPVYAHVCDGCGYMILESEWEEVHQTHDLGGEG